MKALQILKTVLAIIGLFTLGVLTGALLFRKPKAEKTVRQKRQKRKRRMRLKALLLTLLFLTLTTQTSFAQKK